MAADPCILPEAEDITRASQPRSLTRTRAPAGSPVDLTRVFPKFLDNEGVDWYVSLTWSTYKFVFIDLYQRY